MKYIVGLPIIFVSLSFIFIMELRRRKGRLKKSHTYSYKKTFIEFTIIFFVVLVVAIFFHLYFKSIDATIGLAAFLIAYSVAALIRILLTQHRIKMSGGKKG